MKFLKIRKQQAVQPVFFLPPAYATFSTPEQHQAEEAKPAKKPVSEVVGGFVKKTVVNIKFLYGYNKFIYEYFVMWVKWVRYDMVDELKSKLIPCIIIWTFACLLVNFLI